MTLAPFAAVRHAARSLARSPGFALSVVATFALGIGVNTAIFSTAWTLLLGPLPLAEPDRLVRIHETHASDASRPVAPANFLDWRSAASTLSGATSWFETSKVYDAGEPLRIHVAEVSSQFFEVLGATPLAGRFFRGGEARPLAVVSERFWRERLGAGPLEGRTVRFDATTYDVVGVAPASLVLPREPQAWLLAPGDVAKLGIVVDMDPTTYRDARYLGVYARLAPGATVASADAELRAIAARLEQQFPEENKGCGARVESLAADLGALVGRPVALLAGGSLAMLVLTCANVAGLLLARGMAKRREVAVRAALGAGRGGLITGAVAEALLLAMTGGAVGVMLAAWGAPLLVRSLPNADAAGRAVGVPLVVVGFAALVAVAAAAAAAVAPTLATLRVPAASALAAARGALGPSRSRLRGVLVAAQAAIAVLLVASALLVTRTLGRLVAIDPGFDPSGVVTMRLWAPSRADFPRERRAELLSRAVEAADAAPGVARAGAILKLPLTGRSFSAGLDIDGTTFPPGEQPDVCWRVVSDGYFETLGIRRIAGRGFGPADRGGELVALVNESLARRFWPGESAVGRRIRTGLDGTEGWVRIVGVVADTPHTDLVTAAAIEMYRPLSQPNRFASETVALVARTEPGFSIAVLRERLRAVSAELVIDEDTPLADLVRRATARERLLGSLLGAFGALALALAGVGLHGVLALLVAERRRELGLRLAVGARRRELGALVLRRAGRQVLAGVAVGLPLALAAGRAFRGWLHEISPADPASLGGAVVALVAVALLASWIPARRAARVDPMTVLREE